MQKSIALDMGRCRKNVVNFLTMQSAKRLCELLPDCRLQSEKVVILGDEVTLPSIFERPFSSLFSWVVSCYESGVINNKLFTECVEILCSENSEFRLEKYRYDPNGCILYKYDLDQQGYVFFKWCNKKEYSLYYAYVYLD